MKISFLGCIHYGRQSVVYLALPSAKPAEFKLTINGLQDTGMVDNILRMFETAVNNKKINSEKDLFSKKEEISLLAETYLMKNFPQENIFQLEIVPAGGNRF